MYPGGRGVVLSKRERPKLGGAPLQQAVTPGCPPSSIRSQASCQLPAFGPLELNLSSRLVISSTRDVGTKKGSAQGFESRMVSRVRASHGFTYVPGSKSVSDTNPRTFSRGRSKSVTSIPKHTYWVVQIFELFELLDCTEIKSSNIIRHKMYLPQARHKYSSFLRARAMAVVVRIFPAFSGLRFILQPSSYCVRRRNLVKTAVV